MANPSYIEFSYPAGFNLYALLRRKSDRYIYDVGDTAFEAVGTWNAARVEECDIVLTGYDGNLYMAAFPAVASDDYIIQVYLKAGANPATTDALLGSTDTSLSTAVASVQQVLHTIDLT